MILLAVLFLPIFVPFNAQAKAYNIDMQGVLSDESGPNGNCTTGKMPIKGKLEINKPFITGTRDNNYVGLEDEIKIYVEFEPGGEEGPLQQSIRQKCDEQAIAKRLHARLEVFNNGTFSNTTDNFTYYLKSKGNGKLAVNFPAIKLSQMKNPVKPGDQIYFYVHVSLEGNFSRKLETYNESVYAYVQAGTTPKVDIITEDSYTSPVNGPVVDSTVRKLSEINVTYKMRDKYRVVHNETDQRFKGLIFGSADLPRIEMSWTDPKLGLVPATNTQNGTLFEVPKKNWSYTGYPQFQNIFMGFNYSADKKEDLVCSPGWTDDDCSAVVFTAITSSVNGDVSGSQQTLPAGMDPKIFATAYDSKVVNSTAQAGKPLTTVEFIAIPILKGIRGYTTVGDGYSVVLSSKSSPFKVEVYATEADIKAACEADPNVTDKNICSDPVKMRYEVGKVLEVTTGSSETPNGGAVNDLFGFLRKVIAYLVLLITSFVYYIFSTILVPVIVALIGIHPYKDNFVNFIYPGWVIIRNISNIFFIVALLWVGLRTLFQMDDAAKSRTFIIRLILMALLVNFSLVIGQSIVAIADTVQSQFLPEGTKVVEALGHKLMVDPIVTFRGGSDSLTDVSGNFTTDKLASDLPKAIILLVLAVAAFFAFVALIAFMTVRLAALWILYMLSPLAFVGRILPQTEKMADKWWTEFTKYAFAVPIMAFFLNITALMAVTFAQPTGDSVQTGNSGTQALGGLISTGDLGAGYVSFAVTVISHFIILVFLFLGMKFALGFGGFGAEKIVNAAKTGFKKAFEYPYRGAMGAKDWASDKAAGGLEKRGYNNTAKGLAALTSPKVFGTALKKKWIDDPKAKREANQARRIGDIKGLTRSNASAKALDNAKAVQKDFDSEATGYLTAKMQEGDTDNNRFVTQAGMMALAKGKNIDDIVKTAEKITGKKFGRNAAGLNAAVGELAKKQGWTKAEQEQMIKTLDHSASLDPKTAHYTGNADYNSKTKSWTIKSLDPTQDPDHTSGNQQLNPNDHVQWTTGLVNRRLKKNPTEDLKAHSLDSMVTRDASGNASGWTDAQIGVMGGRHMSQLQNREIAKKFKEADNYSVLRQGYERMAEANGGDGRRALIARMVAYNDTYNDNSAAKPKWTPEQITQKADLIHKNFMTDGGSVISTSGSSDSDSGGSGGGSGSSPTGGSSDDNDANVVVNTTVVGGAVGAATSSGGSDKKSPTPPKERPVQFTNQKQSDSSTQAQSPSPQKPTPPKAPRQPKSEFITLKPIGGNQPSSDLVDNSAAVAERERLQSELDQMLSVNDPALKKEIENLRDHIAKLDDSINKNPPT